MFAITESIYMKNMMIGIECKLRRVSLLIGISFLMLISFSCRQNEEKRYLIGVSQCSDDEWRDKLNKEIFLEAMFRGNIDVIFCSANDNNAKQAEDIAYLMKKKVDLMIISPNESAPVTPAVEMAYKSNIRGRRERAFFE